MFAFCYTIFIKIAFGLAKALAWTQPKVRQFVQGRRHWSVNLAQELAPYHQHPQRVWFHVASLGEFEQGRPVIEGYRQMYPDHVIVLTFFSPSGYEICKNYAHADVICYLPIDTPANARRFLDLVRPSVAFFVKYEFWYHFLTELKARHVKSVLFSAIFRPDQVFFKWYGAAFRRMIFCFDVIFVQNSDTQTLLQSIGYQSSVVSGDTRVDRVIQLTENAQPLPQIERFKQQTPLLVVGSAWPDDMQVLIPFLNRFQKPLKIIIAPHEIDQTQISHWQKQLMKRSAKWSDNESFANTDLLFVDCIGLLSQLYQYANFAYIGGAFGDGLHNILEPAAFGVPVLFGNRFYDKFQEAHDLLAMGGAFAVANQAELTSTFEQLYQTETLRRQISVLNRGYINQQKGVAQQVLAYVARG